MGRASTLSQHQIEAPSGKDADYENFPVGSFLLPKKLRPHIQTFYHFARAIDDIADSPTLYPELKISRLEGFAEAVQGKGTVKPGYDKGWAMAESLKETGITPQHCLDLIAAFVQDCKKSRYDNWDDLMGYCILSAAPVGRYLIDLHGGQKAGFDDGAAYAASDALCNALQVLNHLQDIKDDYQTLDRIYLPGDWMLAEKVSEAHLSKDVTAPALRRVIDQCLDETDKLIVEARALPKALVSKRLAAESAAIINIADKLSTLLRTGDPLASRVKLSKFEYFCCILKGIRQTIF